MTTGGRCPHCGSADVTDFWEWIDEPTCGKNQCEDCLKYYIYMPCVDNLAYTVDEYEAL